MDGATCQRRKSEGFCIFGGRQRGRKYSSAFKALTLPPCAFVFCPGTSVVLLLKACTQTAVLTYVHERDKEHYSHSGRWFVCAPFPPYSMDDSQLLFLSHCATSLCCHSLQASILPSSSDSSCSYTSSHLSPLCLSLFIQVCIRALYVRMRAW